MMIKIKQNKTADTRSCDFSKVSKQQLIDSSVQHIHDVQAAINMFCDMLIRAGTNHDADKITKIDDFHTDFLTGFQQTGWWDKHREITRHHLVESDGVPADVNLIDVLEMIADCVMAGLARTGTTYPIKIAPIVLMKAFDNTAKLLQSQVIVEK